MDTSSDTSAARTGSTAEAVSAVHPVPRLNGADRPAGAAERRNGAEASSERSVRRAILVRLRQEGPLSPDALAAALGVSRTGVLQQLRALEAAGLVSHDVERHGVGRPRHRYDVTAEAQDLFPSSYHTFAVDLVAAIREVGGASLVDAVFESRRDLLGANARTRLAERAGDGAPLETRVRELAVLQDEQGYLAESLVGEDGALRLRQHNCAIHRVAARESAACEAELELYRELLGTDVVRETHIAAGDRCCTYRIGPAGPSAAADERA